MPSTTRQLIEHLGAYVSGNKKEKMATALEQRTRRLTAMLENIYQPHNASACLRTCDCLGVQDLHIVEGRNEYRANSEIALGASQWLTLNRYRSTGACLATLKQRGYRLVATTPNADGHDLASLPLDQPVALLFGTEETGLGEEALDAADCTLRLPLYGFTRSYNISVTLAICLSRIVERMRAEEIDWRLPEEDRDQITLDWHRAVVKRHELLEEEFWNREKEQ